MTLLPSRGIHLQKHFNTRTEPTSAHATYLYHLAPAPLFSLGDPTHYYGSNIWNAVLLSIYTTGFPAVPNENNNDDDQKHVGY